MKWNHRCIFLFLLLSLVLGDSAYACIEGCNLKVERVQIDRGTGYVRLWFYHAFSTHTMVIRDDSPDTDKDGVPDEAEKALKTDPNNACDYSSDYPGASSASCDPDPQIDPDDEPDDPDDGDDPDDPTDPGGDGGGTGGGDGGGDDTGGGGGDGDMGGGGDGNGDTGGGDGDGGAPGEGNEPGSGDNGGGSGDEGGNDNNGGGDGNGDTGGEDDGGSDTGGKDEPPNDLPGPMDPDEYSSYLERLIKAIYDTDANSSVKGLGESLKGMSFDDFLNIGKEQSKTAQSIDSKLDSTIEIQYGMQNSILDQYEATKEMGTFIRDLINQDEKFMNDLFAQLDANASKDRSESIDKSLTKVTEQLGGQGEIVSATQSVGGRVKDLTEETERQTNAVHAVNESISRLTDAVKQQRVPEVNLNTGTIESNQGKANSLLEKMRQDSEQFYQRMGSLTEDLIGIGGALNDDFVIFGKEFNGLAQLIEKQGQEQAGQAAAQQKLQEEQAATQKKIQEQQEEFFTMISEEQAREWWPEDFADNMLAKQEETISAIKESSSKEAISQSIKESVADASQAALGKLDEVNQTMEKLVDGQSKYDEMKDGLDLVNSTLEEKADLTLGAQQEVKGSVDALNTTTSGVKDSISSLSNWCMRQMPSMSLP